MEKTFDRSKISGLQDEIRHRAEEWISDHKCVYDEGEEDAIRGFAKYICDMLCVSMNEGV